MLHARPHKLHACKRRTSPSSQITLLVPIQLSDRFLKTMQAK